MAMNYLDFDLSIEAIEAAPGHYRARVLDSPAGEASTDFVLPFSAFELENYILKMGRPRQGVRGLNSTEGRAAQEFGRKLYDTIFQGAVRDCLRSSLNIANQQAEQGLRLRLRLSAAPALADWPWEFLYDTSFRRFFAHSATTPIVRYLDLPQRIPPLAVQPPLKILVMLASPRDYGQLDVEGEWRKVQEALADLVERGLVTLTRLEKATLTSLQRQLRREQYHIFHFIGHGGFDQQTQEGVLLLENENGLMRMVAGSYIGALLHDHRSLRLAVLNACEGARTAQSDPFAGVAQTLVQQGIPAVIAMQFEITDQAAITFAHEFYSAVADRYPVDGALAEARKAIYAEGNDVEWGTPVLYLRAQDGQLFEIVQPQVVVTPAKPPAETPSLPVQAENLQTDKIGSDKITADPTEDSNYVAVGKKMIKIGGLQIPTPFAVVLALGILIGALSFGWPAFRSIFVNSVTTATPTITPTQTATTVSATETPNLIATDQVIWAAQTASAATQTALAPTVATPNLIATDQVMWAAQTASAATQTALASTVTITPTATSILSPLATVTLTSTVTRTSTPVPTSSATDTLRSTLTATATLSSTIAPTTLEPAAGVTKTIEGIIFVFVPTGEFAMGSNNRDDDEKPAQQLNLSGFEIMQTEVTNAQYRTFVDAGGYTQQDLWTTAGWKWRTDNKITQPGYWDDSTWNQADYPVVGVTWYEAVAYTHWLAQKSGLTISLPTEAQWEKAARGPDGRIYPWGNSAPTAQLLNYNSKPGYTSKVGSYPDGKSPYGALDMAGNVLEWTSSQYMAYPYATEDGREDPTAMDDRALRGGSFDDNSTRVRAAVRLGERPDYVNNYIGFRVVLSPDS
ncbi:hypothetical protein BH10CHL1_BH10CHL1_13830 [soil metagenome]